MELKESGVGVANPVGDVTRNESHQQYPQRAVNRNRHKQIKSHDRQAHDDAGEQQRQGGQQIQQPTATQLGADKEPRSERGQQHHHSSAAEAQQDAVLDGIRNFRKVDGGDKILQGEQRKGFERRLHIERQQRGPENNEKRQHEEHEGIEQQQRSGDVAPTAELDDCGPVSL